MRRTFNNLISVLFTLARFISIKLFNWNTFHFALVERFSPNVVFEKNHGSVVTIGKKVRVHSGSKIKVRKNASLILEQGVKINYNCIIACHKEIVVGAGTQFGPSVYLYDHDHDYRAGLDEDKYLETSITIGKNCWIGANTVILRGTKLGDNCVVGAGSVIKGEFPANSVIVQKRSTEVKVISHG